MHIFLFSDSVFCADNLSTHRVCPCFLFIKIFYNGVRLNLQLLLLNKITGLRLTSGLGENYFRSMFLALVLSFSKNRIILLTGVIIFCMYINSCYAQENIFTPHYSVQVPSGWVYKEDFLSESNIVLTTNGFANLLNESKPSQSLLDLVQKGVLLELGEEEHFRTDNISLEKYVKYFLTKADEDDVTVQNATIGGEKAIRIFINGTEIGKTSPMKNVTGSINSLGYLLIHLDKPYYIYYIANEKNFMGYISDFEQIAKTFKFLI